MQELHGLLGQTSAWINSIMSKGIDQICVLVAIVVVLATNYMISYVLIWSGSEAPTRVVDEDAVGECTWWLAFFIISDCFRQIIM